MKYINRIGARYRVRVYLPKTRGRAACLRHIRCCGSLAEAVAIRDAACLIYQRAV